MQITRAMLDTAAEKGLIAHAQAEPLWRFLGEQQTQAPSFRAAHILYYLGGLIAIGAMTLFMTLGWESFGGAGLLTIAACYCAIALGLAELLVRRPPLAIPAGIAAAFAVAMVPLAVYGAQHMLGLWATGSASAQSYRDYHAYIDWRWIVMELATLAAGAVVLWRYRLPFIMLPVAVTLWYLSMDLSPLLFQGEAASVFSDNGKRVSVAFGMAMCLAALAVDLRTFRSKDFAFWLYIFGVLTFWGGLTAMHSGSEFGKFLYCCINLLMIAVGAALSRRVFAVFGGIGIALYLGHLSHSVFKDSMLFPVALTAIGVLVIAAGVWWQRHEAAIGARLRVFLPAPVRHLVEYRAR